MGTFFSEEFLPGGPILAQVLIQRVQKIFRPSRPEGQGSTYGGVSGKQSGVPASHFWGFQPYGHFRPFISGYIFTAQPPGGGYEPTQPAPLYPAQSSPPPPQCFSKALIYFWPKKLGAWLKEFENPSNNRTLNCSIPFHGCFLLPFISWVPPPV